MQGVVDEATIVASATDRQIAQTDDAAAKVDRYLLVPARRSACRSIPPMTNHAALVVSQHLVPALLDASINSGIAGMMHHDNAGAARSTLGR